jgi:hypothetical protein
MDHGLKGRGREGAGRKEQSIVIVACNSLVFLLFSHLPQRKDTNLKIGRCSGITKGFCDATMAADLAIDAHGFGKV